MFAKPECDACFQEPVSSQAIHRLMRSRPPELLGLDRFAEDSQIFSELHLTVAAEVEALLDTHFERVALGMLGAKQLSIRTLVLADFSF